MSLLQKAFLNGAYRAPAVLVGDNSLKLQQAKERLGSNYVLHPEYKLNPKHSVKTWRRNES